MSTLLVELGNTRLKLYLDGKVVSFPTDNYLNTQEFQNFIEAQDFVSIKLAYSTPESICQQFVDHITPYPFDIIRPCDIPLDVLTKGAGIDRLLSAYAAYKKWGASIVFDFGTALTIDCVDDKGRFLGGSIGPGFASVKKEFNHSLPHLDFEDGVVDFGEIPSDTSSAILDGVLGAYLSGTQFLANKYCDYFEGSYPKYVLTGGDADYFEKYFPGSFKEPFLLFEGMLALPSFG